MFNNINDIQICSLNVRGLADDTKRTEVFYWLRAQDSDVILLQETHSTLLKEKIWRAQWGGEVIFSHGESNARGVCMLFKNKCNFQIHSTTVDPNGRYIIVDITLYDKRLTLVNVYGPNNDNPDFYIELFNLVEGFPNDHRIIAGDFNLVLDVNKDKQGGRNVTNFRAAEAVKTYMEDTDLTDVWRNLHPDMSTYTWHRRNPSYLACRLDFFLCSFGMANLVTGASISAGFRSDHSIIKLKTSLIENKRGPGYWKLNCSCLNNIDYVNEIKSVIRETLNDNRALDYALQWEMIKMNVRGKTIEFCSRIKKERENEINKLEAKLSRLLEQPAPSEEIESSIEDTRSKIEALVRQKTLGAKIRSRIRWYEEGEKSTKYFMNLEKRNFNLKTVNRVVKDNGEVVTNKDDILTELKLFYSHLYSKTNYDTSAREYEEFLSIPSPKLDEAEKEALNGEISEIEVLSALKDTQNNKAPGSDGLPAEFYKIFWQDIKEPYILSLKHAHQTGLMSITQRESIISLMPKKDKDTTQLKNWRPLSMLNMDYKLVAKVIANRIKSKLPKLIHPDQTGSVKGRYIGENIVRIIDILSYTQENDIPAVLMCVDFEKAFDNVSWEFLEMGLKHFNFGNEIVKWFKILYNKVRSRVANNGWLSSLIEPSQGVRQGCPLSPYLFVLIVEFLGNHIRANKKIKGIQIGNKTYKISQYADDADLTLRYEIETLLEVEKTFAKFQRVSGLKVNYDKTEILRIGSLRQSKAKLFTAREMCWTNDPVVVLGVRISTDLKELVQINFEALIPKIENQIKMWNMRELSLYGKVLIIKTFLMSQLVYRLSVLPSPKEEFLDKVQKLFFWFFVPKIRKTVLYSEKENGGLNMPNVKYKDISFKVAWVRRLLDSPEHFVISSQQKILCNEVFWKCSFTTKCVNQVLSSLNIKSPFWQDVIKAWSLTNFKTPESAVDIASQVLWFNPNIQIKKKIILNQAMLTNQIYYISDLLNEHGFMDFNSLKIKYPHLNINFVTYYGLLDAIPRQWKLIMLNEITLPFLPVHTFVETFLRTPQPVSKLVYSHIHTTFSEQPKDTWAKWHNIVGRQFEEKEWQDIYLQLYSCTISTELRAFQFKFLHRVLATHYRLCLWKITESDACTFCNATVETDIHLFWECPIIVEFWLKIQEWYSRFTGIYVRLNKFNVLFGIDIQNFTALNIVILVAKHFIYQSSKNNSKPYLSTFIEKLKVIKDIEFTIAYKNDKISKHNNKWGELQHL